MVDGVAPELREIRSAPSSPPRRPVRLAAVLVVASGLTLAAGCGIAPAPVPTVPPAAPAPAAPAPTGLPTAVPTAGPTAVPTAGPSPTPGAANGSPQATPQATAQPTSQAAPQPTSQPAPGSEATPASLRMGASGPAVSALQQRLTDLGYWLGDPDGTYGQLTRQAVMAFQKAEGLTRDGVAGPRTQKQLPEASRPTARTASGDHIEVDLERQLLLVVRGGEVQWAFNTSTGNGEAYARPSGGRGVARTPRGEFEVQRQINGIRRAELGVLYRPKYFNGGIAVHGSGSIPARPASHGCVRVTNAAMDLLWSSNVATIGTPVHVY